MILKLHLFSFSDNYIKKMYLDPQHLFEIINPKCTLMKENGIFLQIINYQVKQ
jgi:hypothetical protein